jgi:hypothetical protein
VSVFDKPGLYLRNPAGGVEDIAAMKNAGFHWISINVGDHAEAEWDLIVSRARSLGVAVFPWQQCLNNEQVDSLCQMARERYNNCVIVNVEKPLDLGYVNIEVVRGCTWNMDACISTEPWLFARQSTDPFFVDWTRVRHHYIEMQLFPQENDVSKDPRNCRAHAYSLGVLKTKFQFGIHDLLPPSFPPRPPRYSVYTADDCGQNYGRWSPQTVMPLSIPYTGPLYGPGTSFGPSKGKTVKALKMAMHHAGFGTFSNPDSAYNRNLVLAMKHFQRDVGLNPTGNYGKGSYENIKTLLSAEVGGDYALTPAAQNLIREDAHGSN